MEIVGTKWKNYIQICIMYECGNVWVLCSKWKGKNGGGAKHSSRVPPFTWKTKAWSPSYWFLFNRRRFLYVIYFKLKLIYPIWWEIFCFQYSQKNSLVLQSLNKLMHKKYWQTTIFFSILSIKRVVLQIKRKPVSINTHDSSWSIILV